VKNGTMPKGADSPATGSMPQIGVKVKIKPARVPKRGLVRPEGQRRIGPESRKESR